MFKVSLDSFLSRKYLRPTKDMLTNVDKERILKYLNINMAEHLHIERLPDNRWGVSLVEVEKKLKKDQMELLFPVATKGLDECSTQTFFLYKEYLKGMKIYVPSNPLISVLKSIDVDMKSSYLVAGTKGYFELSHTKIYPPKHWSKNPMENLIFMVFENALMVSINFVNDLAPTSYYIPLDKKDNLSEVLLDLSFKVIKRNQSNEVFLSSQKIGDEDLDCLRLLFNLIIYITNPNEEFKEEFNKFSPNPKIAQQEQQTYTNKPFIKLGHDVEFLRLVTTETFDVRGHWRWQPVGVGRLGRKLTFISPYQKSQKKFIS